MTFPINRRISSFLAAAAWHPPESSIRAVYRLWGVWSPGFLNLRLGNVGHWDAGVDREEDRPLRHLDGFQVPLLDILRFNTVAGQGDLNLSLRQSLESCPGPKSFSDLHLGIRRPLLIDRGKGLS
jgi:hypothetical protein